MKKRRFCVVMPIYNTEKYLAEAIESVIAQDIGFLENIQMILVNDGSTDGSEKICLEYQAQYPENIKYVKQKNQGVSAARNRGLKLAKKTCEFVNFFDSDDRWEPDAFSKAAKMFDRHAETDVVAPRIKYFERKTNYHPLNFKFNKTKVVNILEDYDHIQLHLSGTFLRTNSLSLSCLTQK